MGRCERHVPMVANPFSLQFCLQCDAVGSLYIPCIALATALTAEEFPKHVMGTEVLLHLSMLWSI